MKETLKLSTLGHTWILDLDGTIFKHNGYKLDGADTFLPGAEKFLKSIPPKDMIIFLTSRKETVKAETEAFLAAHGIRYDSIVYNAPYGERVLVNDDKPSGLNMSIAIRSRRDEWPQLAVEEDPEL